MKRIFVILTVASMLLVSCASNRTGNSKEEIVGEEMIFNGTKYVQVFEDDFEGDKLNPKNWEKCPEWQRQDHGGYWKNDCSWVEDSMLVIEAKKGKSTWESGAVRANGKFEQGYGLYQIKFKIDRKTSGLWYAFWLMGHTVDKVGGGAVDGGEIDIFEVIPNDPWEKPGKKMYLNSAVHWDGYGKDHKSAGSKYFIDDSFYDEWHTVTFEWTPTYYKAYLDDTTEPYWNTEGEGEKYGGIVRQKNYMKITAEFGKWASDVDEGALPAHMYVDYVKVYKPAE